MFCLGYHTVVLTVNNDIFAWGHNRVGQLGSSIERCPRNTEGVHFLPRPLLIGDLELNGTKVGVHNVS